MPPALDRLFLTAPAPAGLSSLPSAGKSAAARRFKANCGSYRQQRRCLTLPALPASAPVCLSRSAKAGRAAFPDSL